MEPRTPGGSAYLLITPTRDDVQQLAELVTTVRAQEHGPAAWVFVDGGSKDGTRETLSELAAREGWIHVVDARHDPMRPTVEGPESLPLDGDAALPGSPGYAAVVAQGFAYARELAEAEGIRYRHVANLDADIRCPPHLLAEMVARMDGDRQVGIASCTVAAADETGTLVAQPTPVDDAPGAGLRVWRRECVEEVGAYPTPCWAGVTGLRARNRGWKTVVYEDLVAETVMPERARTGWWEGMFAAGRDRWRVGAHPVLVAAEAARASIHDRDLRGVALVAGYLEAAVRRRSRLPDPEVRSFYGDDLPRQRVRRLLQWAGVGGSRLRKRR